MGLSGRHPVKIKAAGFCLDLGLEDDLQQHVSEFVQHEIPVFGLQSRRRLVRLIQKIANKRVRSLFTIPRAPVRIAKPPHHVRHGARALRICREPNPFAGGHQRAFPERLPPKLGGVAMNVHP